LSLLVDIETAKMIYIHINLKAGELMRTKSYTAIIIGIISAFFFSLTFVLNEVMANSHGYWLWTASLRYLWTLPMMLIVMWLPLTHSSFKKVFKSISAHKWSWLIWSQFCFVLFYAPLCLASLYLPGWLVSSTWQLTIICGVLLTPLVKVPIIDNSVVKYQRLKIPYRSLPWTVLILSGVLLTVINYSQQLNGIAHLGLSLISLLIAAISYPLGNRKVMAASPEVNGVEKVFGMLICSYPTWIILAIISYFKAGAPTVGMLENTFSAALSSGVVATVLFFQATSMVAKHMPSLAKVEATQSMEVVFSVLLSVLFLGHAIPGGWQLAGLIIMVIGIIGISLR
jgi:drug/metabolite transporter (DMT)-like permease